jgi:hypothetical protein
MTILATLPKIRPIKGNNGTKELWASLMYALMARNRRSPQQAILFALALAWTVFAFSPSPCAFAQSPESQTFSVQQRFLEEQIRPLIQTDLRSAAVDDRFQYDFGAILRYTGLWFEDL